MKGNLQILNFVSHFIGRQQIMDQNQTACHRSNGKRALPTVCDFLVRHSFCMMPQKISILRYYNSFC